MANLSHPNRYLKIKCCCEACDFFNQTACVGSIPTVFFGVYCLMVEQLSQTSAQATLAQHFLNILWKQVTLSMGEKLGSIPKLLT